MARQRSAPVKLDTPTLWTEDTKEQAGSAAPRHAVPSVAVSPAPDELVIDHLVLHYLDTERGELKLVDTDAQLDDAMHAYFVQHIQYADTNAEWHAEFEDPAHATMNTCASLLRLESANFALTTHDLANRLYEIMGAPGRFRERIAPGDMIVVLYHSANNPAHRLAILKVEPDRERHTRDFVEREGRRTVVFTSASNLLPSVEKLQKCAIMWFEADDTAPSLRLLDKDAGPASHGVATFFYKDFLGASLGMSPKRRTRLFWTETNKWLNAQSPTLAPLELLHFFQARRTALSGEILDVRRFVIDALPGHPHDAQSLLNVLVTKLELRENDGAAAFEINAKIAKSYIENVTLLLDGKMKLTVSAENFHNLVRVSENRTGEGKVIITLETLTFQEISG